MSTFSFDHSLVITTKNENLKKVLFDIEDQAKVKPLESIKLLEILQPCKVGDRLAVWGCFKDVLVYCVRLSKSDDSSIVAKINFYGSHDASNLVKDLSVVPHTQAVLKTLTDDKIFFSFDGKNKSKEISVLALNLKQKRKVVPILRDLQDSFFFYLAEEIDGFENEFDDDLIDEIIDLIDSDC